jgi:hypothetical protein
MKCRFFVRKISFPNWGALMSFAWTASGNQEKSRSELSKIKHIFWTRVQIIIAYKKNIFVLIFYLLTYLLTYLLHAVLLEKLTGLQPVKKFRAFHGTRRFITAIISARHLSLSWASSIQSVHPHPTFWRSADAISEPTLYRILTFQVPNHMSLFRCFGRTKL